LGITDIVVVVGAFQDQVRAKLGDGSAMGVGIRYVNVQSIKDGPALGLLDAREYLDVPVFVFLADEFYYRAQHTKLFEFLDREPDALFTYTRTINPYQVMSNFAIEIGEGDRVISIEEKPKRVKNDICGCGTLYITPKVVDALEKAALTPRVGRLELYEVVASLSSEGRIFAVDLDDPDYININTLEDLQRAKFTYRTREFDRFSISVVIPAWNEALSIEHVIKDFKNRPQVKEILVMDNFSEDGTGAVAEKAGAKVLARKYVGYGDAVHAGLDAAGGDILVVVEADYSFRAADLPKIFEYLKDSDAVIGTRTTRQLIAQAANMNFMQRVANVALAKWLELIWIWLEPRFTDIGCSYRAIWKTEWEGVRDNIIDKGPAFTVEMMIEIVKARKRCIEVPVSYHPRFGGESKHTKDFLGLAKTGSAMAWMITSRWLQDIWKMFQLWVTGDNKPH